MVGTVETFKRAYLFNLALIILWNIYLLSVVCNGSAVHVYVRAL